MEIEVCICTFRRPYVAKTLRSVAAVRCPRDVSFSVIVIDNDSGPTARTLVEETSAALSLPVRYIHAPGANISIARNAGLDASHAPWLAFLDDDEIAPPDWLATMIARQRETSADAVFGPSRALYGEEAPNWIVSGDFHSQYPVMRDGEVETGHTCNALLRWHGTRWERERFDISRGKSGGEDTEFFFRLRKLGARFAIAKTAEVFEEVPTKRLYLNWLLRRRFRIGQSYASRAETAGARTRLFATAAVKSAYCLLRAVFVFASQERRAFWLMRGTMHMGVCAGCLKLREKTLYGADA